MPLCTCATEALATGFSSKEAKILSIISFVSVSIISLATDPEKGSMSSCNFLRYSQVSTPIKSGLVDKACPIFIKPGPRLTRL